MSPPREHKDPDRESTSSARFSHLRSLLTRVPLNGASKVDPSEGTVGAAGSTHIEAPAGSHAADTPGRFGDGREARTATATLAADDLLADVDPSDGRVPGVGTPHGTPDGDRPEAVPTSNGTAAQHEVSADQVLDLLSDADADADAEAEAAAVPARADAGDRLPAVPGPSDLAEIGAPAVSRPAGLRQRVYRRRYGAAPFVHPSARRNRRKRRRDYRRLGFVELTPEKTRLRHRILPRTVLGVSLLVLALGVGAAFSGAAFYAYYDWRETRSEEFARQYAEGFSQEYAAAVEQLQVTRNQAIEQINSNVTPLQQLLDDLNAVNGLPDSVGPGVWFVQTLDPNGRPAAGSAFVVSSDASGSLLLTSYDVVRAATARPGPAITLEKHGEVIPAELWSWDADRDLALLRTPRADLPALTWAPEDVRAHASGVRAYGVSGSGGRGATVSPGLVLDHSQPGLRHSIPLSPDFRGGPIVDGSGRVLGVVSTVYRPGGFDPGDIPFAPDIAKACQQVLVCPQSLLGQGTPGATAPPASR